MPNKHILYITAIAIIVFFMVGLFGWSLFLNTKTGDTDRNKENYPNFKSVSDSFVPGFVGTGGGYQSNKSQEKENTLEKKGEEGPKESVAEFKPLMSEVYSSASTGLYVVKNESDVDKLYFAERSNGHIFEILLDNDLKTKRILHRTIPGVKEVLFTENAKGVIRRYADDKNNIMSVYDKITENPEENTVDSEYLDKNIVSITSSPNGKKIFYLLTDKNGVSGYLSDPNGENSDIIWSSWMSEWSVKWVDEKNILIAKKPVSGFGGVAFLLNIETKKAHTLKHSVPGMVVNISPGTDFLLYSSGTKDGEVSTYVKNLKNSVETKLSVSTFADKCFWGNKDANELYCFVPKFLYKKEYPDSWYKGVVEFNDNLWKINYETEEAKLLLDMEKEYNTKIDAENPVISSDASQVFFINKTDQTIWTIKLKEEENNTSDNDINND